MKDSPNTSIQGIHVHPKGKHELNMGIWNLKVQIAAQHPELVSRLLELHENFLKGNGIKSLNIYYESLLNMANEN